MNTTTTRFPDDHDVRLIHAQGYRGVKEVGQVRRCEDMPNGWTRCDLVGGLVVTFPTVDRAH